MNIKSILTGVIIAMIIMGCAWFCINNVNGEEVNSQQSQSSRRILTNCR